MKSIEEVLQSLISGLAAFQALEATAPGGVIPIRPHKLAMADTLAVLIECPEEDDQHPDLSNAGGACTATVHLTCVAETFLQAWSLAEAIRTNNTTPGTGLQAFSGAVGTTGVSLMGVTADKRTRGFAFYQDDSDEGQFWVRQPYEIDYAETT